MESNGLEQESLDDPFFQVLNAIRPPLFPFKNHSDIVYPRIVNVVYTVQLDQTLNISRLSELQPNSKFNNKEFASLDCRIYECGTLLIYNSGSIVIVGAKSLSVAEYLILSYLIKFKKVGIFAKIVSADISNMVACGSLESSIDLAKLWLENQSSSIYNPERFCGLTYRPLIFNPVGSAKKKTIMMFGQTGNFNIMGTVNYEEIIEISAHMLAIGPKYKIGSNLTIESENQKSINEAEKHYTNIDKKRKLSEEKLGSSLKKKKQQLLAATVDLNANKIIRPEDVLSLDNPTEEWLIF